jgi:hypothetical protein
VIRRRLLPALMRTVNIEVVHVLADHGEGVSFVVCQQPVGALRVFRGVLGGDQPVGPDRWFAGDIDVVRVYQGALSVDDIQYLAGL